MKTFAQLLVSLVACREAREWCGNRTAEQAWQEAPRADWMFWLLRALGVADRWMSADMARLFCAEAMEAVGADEWTALIRALPSVVDAETAANAEFWCGFAREAAAYAAADAAYARTQMQKRCADLVRQSIPFAVLQPALQARAA